MGWNANLERADLATRTHLAGDEVITYAPELAASVPVTGIFDLRHAPPADGPSDLNVGDWGPAVFFRLDALPTDPELDKPTITVDGVAYTVRSTHKDGHGGVLLLLNQPEE